MLNKVSNIKGVITMEHPNNLIDSFSGTAEFHNCEAEPIQSKNLLLRGCVLRNSDWVVGVVVNSGHDTKVMMSSTETKPKASFLESTVSLQVLNIIYLLMIFCFVGATGSVIWNQVHHFGSIWVSIKYTH